ncbi:MAG TPA: hypothetical protein VNX28_09830, partial [Gemmataceae bacterium]|nr:hypothetical protein [Gemmataceae bacterium]
FERARKESVAWPTLTLYGLLFSIGQGDFSSLVENIGHGIGKSKKITPPSAARRVYRGKLLEGIQRTLLFRRIPWLAPF